MAEPDSSADHEAIRPPTIDRALGQLVLTLLPATLVMLLFREPKCCTSPIGLLEMCFEFGLSVLTGVSYGLAYPWGKPASRSAGCFTPCLTALLFTLAVIISNWGDTQRLTLTDLCLVFLISLLFAGPAAAFAKLVHAIQAIRQKRASERLNSPPASP